MAHPARRTGRLRPQHRGHHGGGALANWFILLPFYAAAYMPYDAILSACQAINPAIDSLAGYILFGVVPFNLIKGTLVALITFVVYKRISGVLHRWVDRERRTV